MCPGDYEWKKLYQATVDKEIEHDTECGADPTAKWGPMDAGTDGPFAVAFSGGFRNFVAVYHSWVANLVEPSGGNVDLYFHVWVDERVAFAMLRCWFLLSDRVHRSHSPILPTPCCSTTATRPSRGSAEASPSQALTPRLTSRSQ